MKNTKKLNRDISRKYRTGYAKKHANVFETIQNPSFSEIRREFFDIFYTFYFLAFIEFELNHIKIKRSYRKFNGIPRKMHTVLTQFGPAQRISILICSM